MKDATLTLIYRESNSLLWGVWMRQLNEIRNLPERLNMLSAIIEELESNGWSAVAADLRDGISPQTVLRRLREIGEENSDAYEIVAGAPR